MALWSPTKDRKRRIDVVWNDRPHRNRFEVLRAAGQVNCLGGGPQMVLRVCAQIGHGPPDKKN